MVMQLMAFPCPPMHLVCHHTIGAYDIANPRDPNALYLGRV